MTTALVWRKEYDALTGGAGFADVSDRLRLELRGGDRVRFLHSFCTNDVERLAVGAGCEAFVTNHQGKTVGHIFVWREPQSLVVETVPGQGAGLTAHLDRFVISDDVTFHDRTGDTFELLISGPQSRAALERACGANLPAGLWTRTAAAIAGQSVQIGCVDFLKSGSYFVVGPREGLQPVVDSLAGFGIVPCCNDAVDAVRIESGFPLFGRDITDDNFPQELRRDNQAISFTKGCYLGQETVARIDAMGHVNRFLVGVRFPVAPDAIPPAGIELRSGDKVVGHVASVAWSPKLNQPLALARVRRAHSAAGAKLESAHGPAEVVSLPLAI